MPPNTSQQNMDNSLIHRQQYRHQHQQQQQQQMIQRPLQHLLRKGTSGSIQSRSCKTEGHGVSATVCANCGTTTTPLWRRASNGETICNACGLYYKARNTVRPPWLKRNAIKKATPAVPETTDINNNGTCPGDGHCDGTGGSSSCDGCPAYNQHQVNRQALICANCGTNTTPLWRRDEAGNTICNACGLYFKLHNVHRPVTMKRSVIKRRKRVALATSPPPQTHHQSGGSDNEQSRKGHVHNPPTPSSTTGSEHGGYVSSDDDVSIEEFNPNRKRKADESIVSSKRRCGNSRHVPPIEDYISSKRTSHHHGEWIPNNGYDDRRRSLSPVEPTLPQVHIHQNNTSYNSRLMGTPSVPLLPSVFNNNDGANSPNHCPVSFAPSTSPGSSSSISALLNPSSPTTAPPQLPPISSIPPSIMTPTTPPHLPPMNNGVNAAVNDQAMTQRFLQAHRQELQREVSHLSMLLNRTTAILVGLDQAMASTAARDNSSLPSMNYGSPTDGNLYNGQPKSSYTGLPSPPASAGVGQKSYALPPLSPPASL